MSNEHLTEIINLGPSDHLIDILTFIKDKFYKPDSEREPILFGGALTADIYNQVVRKSHEPHVVPNDYDVFVGVYDTHFNNLNMKRPHDITKKEATLLAIEVVNSIENTPELSGFEVKREPYAFSYGPIVSAVYKGQRIEFILDFSRGMSVDYKAETSNIPMDGFAMDRSGIIYGKKDAMSHLAHSIYRIDAWDERDLPRFWPRFEKKLSQYPRLKLLVKSHWDVPAEFEQYRIQKNDPFYERFRDEYWFDMFDTQKGPQPSPF